MAFVEGLGRFLTRAANRLTKPLTLITDQPLWFNTQRVGGELTPEDIGTIMLQGDTGRMWRLMDLAREAREKDCHLHACLSTLELSISGMELQVIPASDKPIDREIAAFVEGIFANFGPHEGDDQALGLADLIQHLTGAYYYSYAVAELLWEKRDGQFLPVSAKPVMPRRFVFHPDTAKLHFWDFAGPFAYPGVSLTDEYPDQFIQFQPRVLGGGPAREGLMRPLLWASYFRTWAMRDWLSLAELAWKPWRVGYYDKDKFASYADVQRLIDAIDYMTTNGSTALPSTVKLDVHWPEAKGGGNVSQHQALAEFMASEISKAVLGQTMTTDNGSSMSQAVVHNQVRKDRRDAAARSVAAILRWQIADRAIRQNYGPGHLTPGVQLAATDVSMLDLSQVIAVLAGPKGPGVPFPVRWIHKILGVPTPKPGEEVVGNPMPMRIPTEKERSDLLNTGGNDGNDVGSAGKMRIGVPPKTRVVLLDGDRDARAHALAELDELAAAEAERIDRAVLRRRATRW